MQERESDEICSPSNYPTTLVEESSDTTFLSKLDENNIIGSLPDRGKNCTTADNADFIETLSQQNYSHHL